MVFGLSLLPHSEVPLRTDRASEAMHYLAHDVLVIDGNPVAAEHQRRELQRTLGAVDTLVVSNCEEALQYLFKWIQKPPKLILLDIHLPGMSGWQFLDRLDRMPFRSNYRPKVAVLTNQLVSDGHRKLVAAYQQTLGIWEKPLTAALIQTYFKLE